MFSNEGFETDYLHRQNVCLEQKTAHSTRIVNGLLGAVEREVADHLSHLAMCVWPRRLPQVT